MNAEAVDGKISFHRTYLEMTERPTRPTVPAPVGRYALMRSHHPTLAFYRFLYREVGRPWLWWERASLGDEELSAAIHRETIEIYVVYAEGTPAGFAELSFDVPGECELRYFGMMPEYVGTGLGKYLLNWAIDYAFDRGVERMSLNTCTLDHPKALVFYQRAGFRPYRQEFIEMPDPRVAPPAGD
jgi:GNAT superfamily N-acetyltransferase